MECRPFLGERLIDDAACGCVDTRVGDPAKPVSELEVEIIEIAERAAQEEVFTDVAERPLDLALGFRPIGTAGAWQEAIVPR